MFARRLVRRLLVLAVCIAIADSQPAARAQSPAGGTPPLLTSVVPISAAARQAAWQRLSPAEREKMIQEFVGAVGPAVRRAIEQRATQASPVQKRQVAGDSPHGVFSVPTAERSPLDSEPRVRPSFVVSSPSRLQECFDPWECDDGGNNLPPEVAASASPTSGNAPLSVRFTALALDPDGFITDTFWALGDGTFTTASNPSHTYTAAGTYLAQVEVIDNWGESAWDTVTITVGSGSNQPPQVSVGAAPATGALPLQVTLTASASDSDGSIVFYSWQFGDGASLNAGASVSHLYSSAGSFAARVTVTDNEGATATATTTIQAMASSADADNDGLSDSLEETLAAGFVPFYHVSGGERPGTGFALFQDVPTLTIQQNLPPTPPVVHWRASPRFVANVDGVPYQYVRVDYLTLWNRDDGLAIDGTCEVNAVILGGLTGYNIAQLLDGIGAHPADDPFDRERSAVLLAAPLANAGDASAYRAYDYFLAAHEQTFFDHSRFVLPPTPLPIGYHLQVWSSRSKHASYAGNPNGLPLMPFWLIALANNVITDLYLFGYINFWEYVIYLAIADSVFFSCAVEDFDEQGGTLPGTTINVGELGLPQNGSSWIGDPRISEKLLPLWFPVP